MKKAIILALVLGSVVCLMAPAYASVFTFYKPDLLTMLETFDNPGGIGDLDTVTAINGGVEYVGDILDGSPQWREIAIGLNTVTDTESWANLSAYTGYGLHFKNVNQQRWNVTTYMVTRDVSNVNTVYRGSWASLLPDETADIVMDFNTINDEDDVRSIGFVVAFDESRAATGGGFQGDKYHMQVSNVPEPSSMLMLGTGLIGLIGGAFRKKFAA